MTVSDSNDAALTQQGTLDTMMLVLVLMLMLAPWLPLATARDTQRPAVTCQQGYAPSHTKVGTSDAKSSSVSSNVALIF